MKMPCEDCLTYPICKTSSKNYNTDDFVVPPDVYKKCIRYYACSIPLHEFRKFFRPDLK